MEQAKHLMSDYLFSPPVIPALPIRNTRRLFPIRRIFCVGRNYEAHAKEMGFSVERDAPFFFTKSAHAYVASGAAIPYPPGTADCHYEMELVAAIGKAGFNISEAQALEYVFGYACGLDMTRRDLQIRAREKKLPWDFGKDFENAAVLSEIAPASVIGHPARGKIELELNGAVKQSSDIGLMIHPLPALIAYLSGFYHLEPGDLLFTGTPAGVGPVAPGDHIEGRIEGVGSLTMDIGGPD